MENALLKIDHKIVQEWANSALTPIHTVAIMPIHTVPITPNRTVVKGCANVVCTYGRTHKHHNSNSVRMTGAVRGSLSVRKNGRRVAVPQTN